MRGGFLSMVLCVLAATCVTAQADVVLLVPDLAEELNALGWPLDLDPVRVRGADPADVAGFSERMVDALFSDSSLELLSGGLELLGLGPRLSADELRTAAVGANSDSFIAYYDSLDTDVFLVRERLERLRSSPPQLRHFLTHELVHASQDQDGRFLVLFDGGSIDEINVRRCLLEGEAEVVARRLAYPASVNRIADQLASPAMEEYFGAGLTGLAYPVGYLYLQRAADTGGRAAILACFERPPPSTEQMLHPEKTADVPTDVVIPDFGPTITTMQQGTLGELQTAFLLYKMGLGPDEALLAACGWDGDEIVLLDAGDEGRAVHWRSVWDRDVDAQCFAEVLQSRQGLETLQRGRLVDAWIADDQALHDSISETLLSAGWEVPTDDGDAESSARAELGFLEDYEAFLGRSSPTTARDAVSALAFHLPSGWSEAEHEGAFVLAHADVDEGFAANLNIQVRDESAAWTEESLAALRADLEVKGRLIAVEPGELAGVASVRVEFSSDASGRHLRTLQSLLWRDSLQFVVTITATESQWLAIENEARWMLETLSFEN